MRPKIGDEEGRDVSCRLERIATGGQVGPTDAVAIRRWMVRDNA